MSMETADLLRLGRADLAAWERDQPSDLYADDADFQALVECGGLAGRAPAFHAAGRTAAGPLDALARETDLPRNHPLLDDWSGVGAFTGAIARHPGWREAGRLAYGTGIMAAYAEDPPPHRFVLGLFYLLAQAGEAGHNCSLACTAGAIRALQVLGTPEQKARHLPRLLDPDFDHNHTASQFLTEVQGGSDVGANACRATSDGGRWRLDGEKWFCSNADGDVFLLTARVGGEGTAGLGLFVAPRRGPDGAPNGFRIRRLKEKIGTRSLATAEVDFSGTEAEALGPVDRGFANTMALVIHTSRLYNAFGCAAHARRAWVVARTYARHRRAFGRQIAAFAQIRETLATMRADAAAALAGSFWLAEAQERADAGTATPEDLGLLRVGVNLNKMRTAVLAHDTVNRGVEVLGGNGTIETFSVLPRLLRDNVVYENWEGTHNVLRAQVLRDCRRKGVHEGFFAALRRRLGAEVDGDQAELCALLAERDADLADLRFRRLADRMATWVMVAAMHPIPALGAAEALTRRHLGPLPVDREYVRLIDAQVA